MMPSPVLLDLFCGAGGAGAGYARAGWKVVGVDAEAQPEYPYEFHQGDALWFVAKHGHEFDAIHASPPCQTHTPVSAYSRKSRKRELVDLLPETRAALVLTGRHYVIENVPQAPMIAPVILCGSQFGLDVYRHRAFETTLPLPVELLHERHRRLAMQNGYLPTTERPVMTVTGRNGHHSKAWVKAAALAMGIPWVTSLNQVCEAIPPAYTEFVGSQLIDLVRATS